MQTTAQRDTSGTERTAEPTSSPLPSLSLPKGGGAIKGIGEKFSVNPVTGTGSLTIPIFTSPGRSDFFPKLSLSYDSGAGNGPFALGWHLSIPSVTRKTDKGLPLYDDASASDVFILSDAEDLMPVLVQQDSQWKPVAVPDKTLNTRTYAIKRYRPRIEGLFARIERWQVKTDGDTHWRATTKDNVTSIYGQNPNCRIADPEDPSRVFKWLLEATFDDKGNVIFYTYKPEDKTGVDLSASNERNRQNGNAPFTNRYIKRIHYGTRTPYIREEDLSKRADWLFEVVFDYGEHDPNNPAPAEDPSRKWATRADPFSSFRSTFDVRTYRLCERVLMFHHFPKVENGEAGYDGLVRSTGFAYDQQDPRSKLLGNPVATKLLSITQTGYTLDATASSYITKSFPPLAFTYSEAETDSTVRTIEPDSLENLPNGLDGFNYQWLDLDGEGLSGILTEQAGALFYKRNLSPLNTAVENGQEQTLARFGALELVATQPSLSSGKPQFMDLVGDGHQDLVSLESPVRGYYERTDAPGWTSFTPFQNFPDLETRDPNLKFVDVDGDGLADILVSEDEVFSWYRSRGGYGFGPRRYARKPFDEEQGPALIFADPSQSIFLADMTGDGITDIVRIRNGEVCYWPNRGYGRFGAKVAMDSAPLFETPDLFDPRRIRLADIDGCGTTDILYLGASDLGIFRNQSGNSWTDQELLPNLPATNNVVSINAVDLLGNGTACLVWSSPLASDAGRQMQYIDLMGGEKPHLLTGVKNNLGAETRVRYAPSTKFYVQDREEGTPWVTKLPFPVYVAERVETFDYIGRTRLVTTYSYRHGYFDGVEREFRGFGYVEQRDAESFGDSGSLFTADTDTEADALHVPPAITKTWFHSGAWPDEETIIQHMAHEYFSAPSEGALLPDTILPTDIFLADSTRLSYSLTGEEQREAVRALKGSILRQEIYADDGTSKASIPYSVSERNYTIECFQPQAGNRYAVFFTHPRETIDYHHERNPTDPRVTHNAVLKADPFGNVLQTISAAYARNLTSAGVKLAPTATAGTPPDLTTGPTPFAQSEQVTALFTLTENAFSDVIDESDAYRAPMPSEVFTYELTRPPRSDDSVVYSFNDLTGLASAATGISYETTPDLTKIQKRLIGDTRTLYLKNDLSAHLPLGKIESLGLVYETYRLALTSGLAQQVFINSNSNPNKPGSTAALSALLSGEGAYVNSEADSNWWIPSGQTIYSPVPQNPPSPLVQDAAYAASHFFLPQAQRDPFGQYIRLTYDSYNLLLAQTEDALGNIVAAQNDYRVLHPNLVTDPNGNQAAARFDALAMVVATAVMGKPGENKGDSFTTFKTDLSEQEISDFINSANPRSLAPSLIGTATTRVLYDLDRFRTTQLASPSDPTKWEPIFAAAIVREMHVSDLQPGQQSKIQVSFSYSDGLGREIQKKVQAAKGPVVKDGPDVNPRWIGSGWTILNNKGKPVRQYEPFFSTTHRFEFANKVGVTPTLFYDPLERVVATLHADHSWEKVVFDPWRQTTYDVNDTVLLDPRSDPDVKGLVADYFTLQAPDWKTWLQQRIPDPAHPPGDTQGQKPDQDAAVRTLAHADTPTAAHFDTLGRPFTIVTDNGPDPTQPTKHLYFPTRTELDIEGNQLSITDALGRQVMIYQYDQVKTKIHSASMDAGERWMLNNVAAKPIRAWDSRGFMRAISYDELQRPVALNVSSNGLHNILAEKTVYGESKVGGPAAPHAINCRGKIYQVYDGSGLITNSGVNPISNQPEGYDFKGTLLRSHWQLLQDYKDQVDWSTNPAFSGETFMNSSRYDALNRVIQQVAPYSDNAGTKLNVIQPGYNEANLLQALDVWQQQSGEPAGVLDPSTASLQPVTNIDYNEKGQRLLVNYGILDTTGKSQVSTAYQFDQETFRLTNLTTTRQSDGVLLQDLQYYYDPIGNITHIQDDADIQNVVYFKNKRVEPSADYTYDAIYRLIQARGREHLGQTGGVPNAPTPQSYNDWPNINLPHPNDGNAMGTYLEQFGYDPVGNIQQIKHIPANPGWRRNYTYAEPSLLNPAQVNNRLTKTAVGQISEPYTHDSHGNMVSMPQLASMAWDFKDQLQMTQRQAVDSQDTDGGQHQAERTYYVYNLSGQRVRKVTESSTGVLTKQRIYLSGFEIYREYTSSNGTITLSLERDSLHVMDDKRRVALVETKVTDSGAAIAAPKPVIRYQFDNHLGSAMLELDTSAAIISYEEYYPYGSTAYQAVNSAIEVSLKRYRYTGKERDEESGLYYYGARYFAPWLGRWTSCDPAGQIDGTNLYIYTLCNPTRFYDNSGKESLEQRIDKIESPVGWFFAKTGYDIWNVASLGTLSKVEQQENLGTLTGIAESTFAGARAISNTASFGLQDRIYETQMKEGPGLKSIGKGVLGAAEDILPIEEADILANPEASAEAKWRAGGLALAKTANLFALGLSVTGKNITVPEEKGMGTHPESLSLEDVRTRWQKAAVRGDLRKTAPPKGINQRRIYEKAHGKLNSAFHVDHVQEMQLGGPPRELSNMAPLDKSPNLSAGPKVQRRISADRFGQRYDRVLLPDERIPVPDVTGTFVTNQMANRRTER